MGKYSWRRQYMAIETDTATMVVIYVGNIEQQNRQVG